MINYKLPSKRITLRSFGFHLRDRGVKVGEKIYNKLVRDKIPQIVQQDNKVPYTHVATQQEVKPLLLQKLIEELEEFKATPNEEELADILK